MIDRAVVFGASSGIGRATAVALAARGTQVWANARRIAPLGDGISLVPGDATDPAVIARALEAQPQLVVVSVGCTPDMTPVEELTWDQFSSVWNIDLKASFLIAQQVMRAPRPGTTVVIVSSGAGLGGSPLSGGYAGAKRMQMFLASYLQGSSDARGLGVRFVALVPKQVLTDTPLGISVAERYAASLGVTVPKYRERFGAPLDAAGVAAGILQIADGDAPAGNILAISGARGLEPI